MIQGTMLLLLCPEVARKKCLGMSLITVDFKRAYSLLVEGPASKRRGYCLLIHSGHEFPKKVTFMGDFWI